MVAGRARGRVASCQRAELGAELGAAGRARHWAARPGAECACLPACLLSLSSSVAHWRWIVVVAAAFFSLLFDSVGPEIDLHLGAAGVGQPASERASECESERERERETRVSCGPPNGLVVSLRLRRRTVGRTPVKLDHVRLHFAPMPPNGRRNSMTMGPKFD